MTSSTAGLQEKTNTDRISTPTIPWSLKIETWLWKYNNAKLFAASSFPSFSLANLGPDFGRLSHLHAPSLPCRPALVKRSWNSLLSCQGLFSSQGTTGTTHFVVFCSWFCCRPSRTRESWNPSFPVTRPCSIALLKDWLKVVPSSGNSRWQTGHDDMLRDHAGVLHKKADLQGYFFGYAKMHLRIVWKEFHAISLCTYLQTGLQILQIVTAGSPPKVGRPLLGRAWSSGRPKCHASHSTRAEVLSY